MIDRTARRCVSNPLIDCLTDIDLVSQVFPARLGRKLINKTLGLGADIV